MRVELIQYNPEAERLVAQAAKLCYSPLSIKELLEKPADQSEIQSFIKRLLHSGHLSPIEHASYTFAIEGISRACANQLVRHRIASVSQKSQRYVSEDSFEYIVPSAIVNDKLSYEEFVSFMNEIKAQYILFTDRLESKYIKEGVPPTKAKKKAIEDARYVLPNACETKLILTMNARSLYNFFSLRCCNNAQWEIRALAKEMLRLVKEVAPNLFVMAGADCQVHGMCSEGLLSCKQSTT